MALGARDALVPLLRGVRSLSTSPATAQYAPAVKTSSGTFSWLFGGSSRSSVPLSEPLPDVVIPKSDAPPEKPLAFQTTALSSGTKLAAFDALGPLGGAAVIVNTGSIDETPSSTGAAFLISQLAFRATKHRTTFRLVRELDKIGATTYSKAGRDTVSLSLKVNKLHLPEAVEILLDATLNPRFNSWEVKDSLPYIAAALEDITQDPNTLLQELLHKTAFSGALGQALLPDVSNLNGLTPEVLKSFHSAHFVPGKIAVVGAGVDLEKFQGFASPLIPSSSDSVASAAASKYIGGFVSALAAIDKAYVAIGFEAIGGKSTVKSAATAAVAASLLDVSKTAVPFLDSADTVLSSSQPLLALYKDTGVIGLAASAASADVSKVLDAISTLFTKYAKGVSEAELKAAQGRVLRAYSQTLTTVGTLEDVGSQLLAAGAYTAGSYSSAVASVTAADVSAYLAKALKTPATVVTYGSLGNIPRYSEISKRFA